MEQESFVECFVFCGLDSYRKYSSNGVYSRFEYFTEYFLWCDSQCSPRSVCADGAQTYDYTLPMTIFALFGVLALIVALMLKAENKKKGYGLEEANIQK